MRNHANRFRPFLATLVVVLAWVAVRGTNAQVRYANKCEIDGKIVLQSALCPESVPPESPSGRLEFWCKADGGWVLNTDPRCPSYKPPQDRVTKSAQATDQRQENLDHNKPGWPPWVVVALVLGGLLAAAFGLAAIIRWQENSVPINAESEPGEKSPGDAANPQEKAIQEYIDAHSKSYGIAFALALLFGPIGLLYASPLRGVIMILLAIFLFSGFGVVGGVLAWLLSVLLCFGGVADSQRKAKSEALLIASK